MRNLRTWVLALLASAVWVTPARPQQQQAGGRLVPEEGAVQVMLLRQKSVQDALKLTDDEAKKIDTFTTQQWKKALDIEEMPAAERERKYAQLTKENDQFIADTLTPQERKRLDQITLQVAGLLWVTRPEVASRLGLTDAQKTRAKQMQKEARMETEEAVHAQNASERNEKFRELRNTSRKRLLELLTDEQEATWKDMVGDRFEGEIRFGVRQAGTP